MNKTYALWLVLGAYGVWFAILSGLEDLSQGRYWKAPLALIFGIISYWLIEKRLKKN